MGPVPLLLPLPLALPSSSPSPALPARQSHLLLVALNCLFLTLTLLPCHAEASQHARLRRVNQELLQLRLEYQHQHQHQHLLQKHGQRTDIDTGVNTRTLAGSHMDIEATEAQAESESESECESQSASELDSSASSTSLLESSASASASASAVTHADADAYLDAYADSYASADADAAGHASIQRVVDDGGGRGHGHGGAGPSQVDDADPSDHDDPSTINAMPPIEPAGGMSMNMNINMDMNPISPSLTITSSSSSSSPDPHIDLTSNEHDDAGFLSPSPSQQTINAMPPIDPNRYPDPNPGPDPNLHAVTPPLDEALDEASHSVPGPASSGETVSEPWPQAQAPPSVLGFDSPFSPSAPSSEEPVNEHDNENENENENEEENEQGGNLNRRSQATQATQATEPTQAKPVAKCRNTKTDIMNCGRCGFRCTDTAVVSLAPAGSRVACLNGKCILLDAAGHIEGVSRAKPHTAFSRSKFDALLTSNDPNPPIDNTNQPKKVILPNKNNPTPPTIATTSVTRTGKGKGKGNGKADGEAVLKGVGGAGSGSVIGSPKPSAEKPGLMNGKPSIPKKRARGAAGGASRENGKAANPSKQYKSNSKPSKPSAQTKQTKHLNQSKHSKSKSKPSQHPKPSKHAKHSNHAHSSSLVAVRPTPKPGVTKVATNCKPGFADCKGEGVCNTNLMTSFTDCGVCGKTCTTLKDGGKGKCSGGVCIEARPPCDSARDCTADNAITQCTKFSRTCEIKSCHKGFGDCDAIATNGCEVNLQNDENNCGECGKKCAIPNLKSQRCRAGTCQISSCLAGHMDCDGRVENGCETNVMARHKDHCGACNNQCSTNHAMGICDNGTCRLGLCHMGWGDCDDDITNGCESSLTTPQHCGECRVKCAYAHAQGICTKDHVCHMGSCDPGWADCDGSPSNGCEQSVGPSGLCRLLPPAEQKQRQIEAEQHEAEQQQQQQQQQVQLQQPDGTPNHADSDSDSDSDSSNPHPDHGDDQGNPAPVLAAPPPPEADAPQYTTLGRSISNPQSRSVSHESDSDSTSDSASEPVSWSSQSDSQPQSGSESEPESSTSSSSSLRSSSRSPSPDASPHIDWDVPSPVGSRSDPSADSFSDASSAFPYPSDSTSASPSSSTAAATCDGDTDLSSDAANCGVCGFRCEPGLVCHGGWCRVPASSAIRTRGRTRTPIRTRTDVSSESGSGSGSGACGSEWADCSVPKSGGCTTNLWTDPLNCGACGFRCEAEEHTDIPTCRQGFCALKHN